VNKQRTLVFFGAHPDDESFGVGSTLAHYAAHGIRVYYVCSTGGELGTVDKDHLREYDTIEKLRVAELKCAADVLGLAGVFYLGYRDSGMDGSSDNMHPHALAMAPLEEVAGRAIKIIRQIRPDVVITHDPLGSYGHPDHIATHKAVVDAFHAAGDLERYPQAGQAFQPKKLYFKVRSRRLMKMASRLMPLFGQDPHHFGRNKDMDITKMAGVEYPVHAVVRLEKESIKIRNEAIACHASQSSGRSRPWLFKVIEMLENMRGPRDYFMRAYPPPTKHIENDLFEGIH
jgi:N-acetyl-1-D-myo-inositol-2-amino-2-deoxy-alpha-D-glucopyranoside deacetylase